MLRGVPQLCSRMQRESRGFWKEDMGRPQPPALRSKGIFLQKTSHRPREALEGLLQGSGRPNVFGYLGRLLASASGMSHVTWGFLGPSRRKGLALGPPRTPAQEEYFCYTQSP